MAKTDEDEEYNHNRRSYWWNMYCNMLQKNGYTVQLYEASSSMAPVGAELGVGSNALQAMYEADVGEQN